jgi:catechol 2,3-dioxygenase-like lactoylglutathione lyase family enzyme
MQTMTLERLDHLVLTVRDVEVSIHFYTQVLGMTHEVFGKGRHALKFGQQKINLHPADSPIQPHAAQPSPGSADLCFITTTPLHEVVLSLQRDNVIIDSGPVERSGAQGPILSVYFRDPDGNLLEVSNPL